jgi:hypothetical protein
MSNSLLKYRNKKSTDKGGEKLWWNRASVDGLPFRGPTPPIMTEDEYESRVIRVATTHNGFFDVREVDGNSKYLEVLECCYNGWFQLVHLERFWVDPDGRKTTLHYVEWAEYYLEDGNRTPYLSSTEMELARGQTDQLPPLR